MSENEDGADGGIQGIQAGGGDIDAGYTTLMTQVAALDREALHAFGVKIGLLEEELAGTVRTSSKKIRERIETTLDKAEDEAAELRSVIDMLTFLAPPHPHPQEEHLVTGVTNVQDGGERILELAAELEAIRETLGAKSVDLDLVKSVSIEGNVVDVDKKSGRDVQRVVLRSECKIKGQIGKVGQSLTFVSLQRQVETLKLDFPEQKVVEAVVQAVNPLLPLRSFLDSKIDMTLLTLMSVLKSHYRESDSTVLFNKLANASQASDEDSVSFLLRTMELKAKVLFVSKTSDIKYSQEQVQRLFVKVVEAGLTSESVRVKFRSSLDATVTDEVLLERLTQIVTEESDRDAKLKQNVKAARVRKVETCEPDKKYDELKEMVERLTVQVQAMVTERQSSDQQRVYEQRPYEQRPPRRGCTACQKDGIASKCRHCYKCGRDDGHISRDCPLNG